MPLSPARPWTLYQKNRHPQHFHTLDLPVSVVIAIDCVTVDKTTTITVFDGVQQTVTHSKVKLCPTHLVPDTTPPLPELDLSVSELILNTLGDGNPAADPFNLLSDAAQLSQCPQLLRIKKS